MSACGDTEGHSMETRIWTAGRRAGQAREKPRRARAMKRRIQTAGRRAEQGLTVAEAQHTLLKLAGILGLTLKEKTQVTPDAEAFIGLLVSIRDDLRRNRQWQLADKIRSGLTSSGVILEDTPQGTRWVHKRV